MFFFFKISIFILKCPLHIASYALRIGVSVPHISTQALIARTGNYYNVCTKSLIIQAKSDGEGTDISMMWPDGGGM